MKNLITYSYLLILSAATLLSGGCVMENYDDIFDTPSSLHTIGYMSVNLESGNGDATRALGSEFSQGVESELALSGEANHYVIFYGESENLPLAIATLESLSRDDADDPGKNTSVVLATIAGTYEEDQIDVIFSFRDCIVILNTSIKPDELMNMSKSELLGLTVDSPYFVSKEGKKYFIMSNALYAEGNKRVLATEFDPSQVYNSYMEAIEQAWKGNAAVTAHVERIAARLSLSFANSAYNAPGAVRDFEPKNNDMTVFSHMVDNIPYYSEGRYKYKVRITGWGLNGLERSSYLFRNFDPAKNYFAGWSTPNYKRVFWSEDLNYEKDTYPWQYRKVIDKSGIPVYQKDNPDDEDGNILLNLTYNELNSNKFTDKYAYAPENTYNFSDRTFMGMLNSEPGIIAGTHMVVCAELLTNAGSDPNVYEAYDTYRDRNGNFYISDRECFEAMVSIFNNILGSHSSLKFTYWDWEHGNVERTLYANTKGDYALYLGDMRLTPENIKKISGELFAPAEFKGGDGKCILWLDDLTIKAGNQELQIYSNLDEVNPDNNVWYRTATVNDIKSLIFEHTGGLDHYRDGKMYYSIPIGLVRNDGASSDTSTAYDVEGVVRNASYEVVIQEVQGLGAPVDNPDQPVIGCERSTKDNLFVTFKILDWHPIEQIVPGEIK